MNKDEKSKDDPEKITFLEFLRQWIKPKFIVESAASFIAFKSVFPL